MFTYKVKCASVSISKVTLWPILYWWKDRNFKL